jgi:hypothetical protein
MFAHYGIGKICNALASLAPEPCRPIHALYIRVDSEAYRGCCGYDCFGELNSLVEVSAGITCEFYFHQRYNWHAYGGFLRFAQKACSQGECWLYEACVLLTTFEKLEEKTVDLGKGPQQILQIYQPGHEEVCAVCLHGAIPKEQLAVVKVVAKNVIAQVSDEWAGCGEAFGFTSTLTRRQYEIGTAHAATLPVPTAPKPAEEKPKRKSRACEETGCGNVAAWGAKRRCVAHGGGARCEELGCGKSAVGSTAHCAAHGGGARCEELGCSKSAVGSTPRCKAHGGGARCEELGCGKSARGSTARCIAHGARKKK